MKGIYLTSGIDITKQTSGISKKIKSQLNIFQREKMEIDFVSVDNSTSFLDKIIFFIPLLSSKNQKELINSLNNYNLKKYDFIYIRKPVLSLAFIKLLKKIKKEKNTIRIVMEIPTYPYFGEYTKFKKILIVPAMTCSLFLHKYIDKIITYSLDDQIWKIPTIKISNSIEMNDVKQKKIESDDTAIHLVAVAMFSFWHGYDRLIKGLANYYNNGGIRNIKLYLVGNSRISDEYKSLVQKLNLENYIVFCGEQYGQRLDDIYDVSDIAIDSLGRFRAQVFYNSSIKGKEYGAKGLPIISGVCTELDYDKDYKYYLRVPNDDSPIDIQNVIKFYDSIYTSELKKNEVILEIRKYFKRKFDFSVSFEPVIEFLKRGDLN